MSSPGEHLGLYLHLARAAELRRQPLVRDRLLFLAGVIAALGVKAYRRLGRRGLLEFAGELLASCRDWATETFASPHAHALLAPWVLHTGLGPDAAASGFMTRVIAIATWLERITYRKASAVTVLSDDLRDNVAAKVNGTRRNVVHVIPNFVDTDTIRPLPRLTRYRAELGIGDEPVVLYAGNLGFSQSLELVIEAARRMPAVTFVINGDGVARPRLERAGAGLRNLRFAGYQPAPRLAEVHFLAPIAPGETDGRRRIAELARARIVEAMTG